MFECNLSPINDVHESGDIRVRPWDRPAAPRPQAGGMMVFDRKGRLVKADARAQVLLGTVGISLAADPRLRIDALDMTESRQKGDNRLPDWLDAEWIEPVMDGEEQLGTVVSLPAHLERSGTSYRHAGLPVHKLRRVVDFIHSNIDQPIRLERLAATVAMSPFHFHRQFKRSTGMTPHQYILQVRLERARELLSGSNLPLAEVAVQVGFADQSHFTSAFRRTTSMTPGTYRNAAA